MLEPLAVFILLSISPFNSLDIVCIYLGVLPFEVLIDHFIK